MWKTCAALVCACQTEQWKSAPVADAGSSPTTVHCSRSRSSACTTRSLLGGVPRLCCRSALAPPKKTAKGPTSSAGATHTDTGMSGIFSHTVSPGLPFRSYRYALAGTGTWCTNKPSCTAVTWHWLLRETPWST
eukprot:1148541-Rhodomonas_salina.2